MRKETLEVSRRVKRSAVDPDNNALLRSDAGTSTNWVGGGSGNQILGLEREDIHEAYSE